MNPCEPLTFGVVSGSRRGKEALLTQNDVGDDEGEDKDGEEGQRENEQVEEAVVSLSHAIAYPRAVVVKTICGKKI